jgi:hypothetical protein
MIYKLLSLLTILVIGCGKKDKTSSTRNSSQLEGRWTRACGTDPEVTEEAKQYDSTIIVFKDSSFSATIDLFSDSSCKTKLYSTTTKGSFIIGGDLLSPTGAKAIDYTPTESIFTLYEESYVQQFNGEVEDSSKVCGGGWVLGQSKTLTNALCKNGLFSDIDDKNYDLFKIDGKSLFEGDSSGSEETDGSSAAKRPKILATRPYIKS